LRTGLTRVWTLTESPIVVFARGEVIFTCSPLAEAPEAATSIATAHVSSAAKLVVL
jgi:hypothetical protein